MPVDWSKYPNNWKKIAAQLKKSVGYKCEDCKKNCYKPGEKVHNHKRVLTVAHINHDTKDSSPENLIALCSVCHLQYDFRMKKYRKIVLKRRKCHEKPKRR